MKRMLSVFLALWLLACLPGAYAEAEGMFTDRDMRAEYDGTKSIQVQLNGTSAAASSNSVRISGSVVTLTEEAVYVLSGTLEDGMIVVNAPDTAKLQIVLDGVSITSQTSAPLYILQADKVFLTLAPGTENTLANGGSFTAVDENNIDAAVFSKQDLTLNGSGSLTVTSPAGHGIVCKDDLVITGGSYAVHAASHGLDVNDSVRITGETSLTIDAGKDGVHCENTDDAAKGFVYIANGMLHIEAQGDGIDSGAYVHIEGGSFDLLAGGGSVNGSSASSGNYGGFMGGGRGGFGAAGAPAGNGGGRPGDANAPRGNDDGGTPPDMPDAPMEDNGNGTPPDMPAGDGDFPGGGRGGRGMMQSGGFASMQGTNEGMTTTAEQGSTSMKGIKAAGSIVISGGSFVIDSADDSMHSNASITISGGSFEMASGDDAVHADDTLTITAGTIRITGSYEGLEALHIDIQGGDIDLTATDDGINAAGGTDLSGMTGGRDGMFGGRGGMSAGNGSIVISGGNLYVNASGDGIDANGTLEITGGYTVVVGPTQGDTATLDYDTSGVITGGTFIGTGASNMAQTFSSSAQGVIAVSVGNQSAGTAITLTDSSGKTLIDYTPELDFAVVILSSPDIITGQTYTITVGTQSGAFQAS